MVNEMSKTLKIRKAITAKLKERVTDVFYGHAPAKRETVFAVFNLEETDVIDGCTTVSLLVELSDYGADDTAIETLADAIQSDFDHHHYLDESLEFMAYLDSRKQIPEKDKLILRRRLEFELRVYGG